MAKPVRNRTCRHDVMTTAQSQSQTLSRNRSHTLCWLGRGSQVSSVLRGILQHVDLPDVYRALEAQGFKSSHQAMP